MTTTTIEQELENAINQALKKIGTQNQNDLSRYISTESGHCMHHFSFHKLKKQKPSELLSKIKTCILDPKEPTRLPPPPRNKRRQSSSRAIFTKDELKRLMACAKEAGHEDLVDKIMPKVESLSSTKQRLRTCITNNDPDEEAWRSFVKMCSKL